MKTADDTTNRKGVKRSGQIDDFVMKRARIISENNEDILNISEEIIKTKKTINPFDSTDSDDSDYENNENSVLITDEEREILDYFNNSTEAELSQITGCSETKALRIIQMRPFKSFQDLKANKISDVLIDGCLEILSIKQNLMELLKKCQKISSNLTERIQPLLVNVDIESSLGTENLMLAQPKYLNPELQLKSYQTIGINWLRIVHEENLNGILADEMGLGKTVQTIAFLSYLIHTDKPGPHIIIVPTSTLNNWERELHRWCPDISVVVYYGNPEERRNLRYEILQGLSYNVILTTYQVSISSKDDRLFIKKLDFYYGVFDEAHMLKNMLSIRYKYLSNFKIKRKLLLTGTPLQNNLVELISLLSFVMPNMFLMENAGLKKIFQFSQKSSSKQSSFTEEKIQQVKEMLTPFCLRRLKSQVLSQLPKKTVEVVILPLLTDQMSRYQQVIERMKDGSGDIKTPVSIVMELRKISNHSLLTRKHYTEEILRKMAYDMLLDEDHIASDKRIIFEDFCYMHDFDLHQHCERYSHAVGKYKLSDDMLYMSNKIQYLNDNLPVFIENGDRILIFSQFVMVLEILEEFLKRKQIEYVRLDGSTSADDRLNFIDQFNENENIKVFILTTRAGGLGINLTSANVVIIHDIDYNPYNDKQAEDRSHRLGQLRDVRVIKLISKNTIEENILRIANEKLKLELMTMNNDNDDDEVKSSSSEPKDVDFAALLKQACDI